MNAPCRPTRGLYCGALSPPQGLVPIGLLATGVWQGSTQQRLCGPSWCCSCHAVGQHGVVASAFNIGAHCSHCHELLLWLLPLAAPFRRPPAAPAHLQHLPTRSGRCCHSADAHNFHSVLIWMHLLTAPCRRTGGLYCGASWPPLRAWFFGDRWVARECSLLSAGIHTCITSMLPAHGQALSVSSFGGWQVGQLGSTGGLARHACIVVCTRFQSSPLGTCYCHPNCISLLHRPARHAALAAQRKSNTVENMFSLKAKGGIERQVGNGTTAQVSVGLGCSRLLKRNYGGGDKG